MFFLTLVVSLESFRKMFTSPSYNLVLKQPIDPINKYEDPAGSDLSRVDQVLSADLKDFTIKATIVFKRKHSGLVFK